MAGDTDNGEQPEKKTRRLAAAARRLDSSPALLTAARLVRELLPGDSQFGDPLSTGGRDQAQLLGRRLAELTDKRPGLLRETGLSALQVWESISESQGRGRGKEDLAILFTDLVEFSDWALEAGDDIALDLLRQVAEAIEPPVVSHHGEVVKRLGDGMMAVFSDADAAVEAVFAARERLDGVEVAGYRPRMRAGIHVGTPRRLADDYLGVDVNVAARVADSASGGELLVSGVALEEIEPDSVSSRKKLMFRAKGVPSDISVYSLKPR
jgi:adenylate cyclase